eukprot:UN05433
MSCGGLSKNKKKSGGSNSKRNPHNNNELKRSSDDEFDDDDLTLDLLTDNLNDLNLEVAKLKSLSDLAKIESKEKKSRNENKSAECDENKSAECDENESAECLLDLFCGNCRRQCRLKWPISEITNPDWEDFDYLHNLRLYSKTYPTTNTKFGRMDGRDMLFDCNQINRCRHKIGYGAICCSHCDENVTENFHPKMRNCPNCET